MTRLILVGGFLGAGKTRLILASAALLESRGLRVGIVTNDQGEELVDTAQARAAGFQVAEVPGGCFCCRLSDLLRAADSLREYDPDILFAEPVGSCTDIAATVLAPLRQVYGDRFRLAPFTVLVDPARAADLDEDERFLFDNQCAEADLIVFTKSDLGHSLPEWAGGTPRRISAKSGDGVSAWLDEILEGSAPLDKRVLDIDYARYAEAEAALGWLNWKAKVSLPLALLSAQVAGPFLGELDCRLSDAGIRIAHMKLAAESDTGWLRASLTSNGAEPEVEGRLDTEPVARLMLTLNLRAHGEPETLAAIVAAAAANLPGSVDVERMQAFRPAAPKPQMRIA